MCRSTQRVCFVPVPWITSVHEISRVRCYALDEDCDLRGSAGKICRLLVEWKDATFVKFTGLCHNFVWKLFVITLYNRRLVRERIREVLRTRLEGHCLAHKARAEGLLSVDAIFVC